MTHSHLLNRVCLFVTRFSETLHPASHQQHVVQTGGLRLPASGERPAAQGKSSFAFLFRIDLIPPAVTRLRASNVCGPTLTARAGLKAPGS